MTSVMQRWLAFGLAMGVWLGGPRVKAQDEQPMAALMRSSAPAGQAGLAGALDRFARSALDELEVVRVTGTLALDLEQAQLALGCMAENPACLKTVADENEVTVLLAPRIDRAGEELVLTVLMYDGQANTVSQGVRRVPANAGADGLLDRVPGLLRELFGLPQVEEPDPIAAGSGAGRGPGDGSTSGTGDGNGLGTGEGNGLGREPARRAEPAGIGLGGPILLGVGAAALVGGVVAAVLHSGAKSDYEDHQVTDAATARDASSLFDQAQTRGHVATGLLIGGGVVAAAGLVWLLVDLLSGDGSDADAPAQRAGVRTNLLLSSRMVGASVEWEVGR